MDAAEARSYRSTIESATRVAAKLFDTECNLGPSELSHAILSRTSFPRLMSVFAVGLRGTINREVEEEIIEDGIDGLVDEMAYEQFEMKPEGLNLFLLLLSRLTRAALELKEMCTAIPENRGYRVQKNSSERFVYSVRNTFTETGHFFTEGPIPLLNDAAEDPDVVDQYASYDQIEALRQLTGKPKPGFGQIVETIDGFWSPTVEQDFKPKQLANFRDWRDKVLDPIKTDILDAFEQLRQGLADRHELAVHVKALSERLKEAELEELLGENQGDLVVLYRRIHDAFDSHNLITPNRLAAVPKDVHRINQIETIIDLYNLKIQRTENDQSLDEGVRDRKVQALQHLMEKDIEALGGVV